MFVWYRNMTLWSCLFSLSTPTPRFATPKTISGQVHANPMKFSRYVGTVVEKLWQIFQPYSMTFEGDIHQTRVKNSSFGIPKLSGFWFYRFNFFCLKEPVRMQGMTRPFFLNSYFLCEKRWKVEGFKTVSEHGDLLI